MFAVGVVVFVVAVAVAVLSLSLVGVVVVVAVAVVDLVVVLVVVVVADAVVVVVVVAAAFNLRVVRVTLGKKLPVETLCFWITSCFWKSVASGKVVFLENVFLLGNKCCLRKCCFWKSAASGKNVAPGKALRLNKCCRWKGNVLCAQRLHVAIPTPPAVGFAQVQSLGDALLTRACSPRSARRSGCSPTITQTITPTV